MPVYMIQAGGLPIVKIGKADNVVERIAQHQTAHWETLKLIRQWEGGVFEEEMLHLRFADMRLRGEWFTFSRAMMGDVGLVDIPLPSAATALFPMGAPRKRASSVAKPKPKMIKPARPASPSAPDPILPEIEGFLAASGMTATKFGRASFRDPTLVWELRKGRELRRDTRERLREFIQSASSEAAA